MQYTTDEQQAATLRLLDEVLEYMRRLPAVPTTTALCRKVEEHLQDPQAQLVMRENRLAGQVYGGAQYTPWGSPLILAQVTVPTEVRIWTKKPSSADHRRKMEASLLRQLQQGGFSLTLDRHFPEKPPTRGAPD